MKIGYARVSTYEQNLDSQIDSLKAFGCEKIFQEKVSTRKEDRKKLKELFSILRKGDVLVCTKMDRLARSLAELISIAKTLEEKEVDLVFIDQNISTAGASGKLIFHIMGAFAEFERDMIRERTLAGLASARARGRKGGRKRLLDEEQKKIAFKMYDSKDYTIKEIANAVGIKESTLYLYLKRRKAGET